MFTPRVYHHMGWSSVLRSPESSDLFQESDGHCQSLLAVAILCFHLGIRPDMIILKYGAEERYCKNTRASLMISVNLSSQGLCAAESRYVHIDRAALWAKVNSYECPAI